MFDTQRIALPSHNVNYGDKAMKKKEIAEKLEEVIAWAQFETDSLRSAMESVEIEIRDNNATVWKYIHDAIESKLTEIIERMDKLEQP